MNLPNYEDLGFNKFLERQIGSQENGSQQAMMSSGSTEINFDNAQMSGSLGDMIQVGGNNIIIDGANRRIVVNDGNNDRIVIGEYE